MTKLPYIMLKQLHIIIELSHIMNKSPYIMTKVPQIMTKVLHVMAKVSHIMKEEAPHIVTINHLRQSWHSIIEIVLFLYMVEISIFRIKRVT